MKRTYTIILLIWLFLSCCSMRINAQTSENNLSREKINQDTTLVIIRANDKYSALSSVSKAKMVNEFLRGINTELASIYYDYHRELWRKDNATGNFVLLDSMNVNGVRLIAQPKGKKLAANQNFVSFGGLLSYQNAFNAIFNGSVGRFLWKDKLDIALSIGCGFSSSATTFNIGPVSKYYYPMVFKEQRISPYIGAGISYYYSKSGDTEGNSSCNIYGTVGSSWRIGIGALDAGFRFGNVSKFSFVISYTFLF